MRSEDGKVNETWTPVLTVQVTGKHAGCGGELRYDGLARLGTRKYTCEKCGEPLWLGKDYPRIEYVEDERI